MSPIRIAALLMLAQAAPALGQPVQDTTTLDRLVERFTGVPAGQPGGAQGPVDPRLRLTSCAAEPVASWFGRSQTTVRLDCRVPGGWTVYVPLHRVPESALPPTVARGDTVSVQLRGRGFVIAGRGEALSSGESGSTVSVRLAGQERGAPTVTATVLAPGKVGIDLP